MEDVPVRESTKSKSKTTIIMAIAILLLAAGLVVMLSLYFAKSNKLNDIQSQQKTTAAQLAETQKQMDTMSQQFAKLQSESADNSNSQSSGDTGSQNSNNSSPYFAVSEWGVKFVLPGNLSSDQIQYYINGDKLSFTTAEVAALGNDCRLSSATSSIPLGSIQRAKSSQNADTYAGTFITQLGDTYYYYQSAQATCSDSNTSLQTQDLAKIRNLIFTITAN